MDLRIYDDIVNDADKEMHYWMTGSDGISFKDIDEFVAAIPDDDPEIRLLLHCRGGSVSEGWAMVDKLRSTGKKITATIEGQCASMAVSLLLAASERRAHQHAQLLIHDPYIPEFTLADAYTADELQKMADDLKAETDKLLDFYVERTGADRDELAALMKEDKFIDMDRAKELGFIQEIIAPASARAKSKFYTMAKDVKKNKQSALAAAVSALAGLCGLKVVNADDPEVQNYVLTTEDGTELTIDKPEGEDPAVGDSASPDGEHDMPDGTTIVVVDGVITEIIPADPDLDNETAEETIARLEQELEEARAAAVSEEQQEILNAVEKAGGKKWLDKVTSSNYVPQRRTTTSKQTRKVEPKSKIQERLAHYKENRTKQD